MTTLFDLTYRTAREIMVVREGVATNGSVTTIVDTVNRKEAINFWEGGSAWILYDSAGLGALPQGQFSRVSGFTATTSTLTLNTTLTAVAAGDRYAVAAKRFTLQDMIQAVNRAVMDIHVVTEDITTVTTASNQTEYTLPIAADLDLRTVHFQTHLNDANDNRWVEILRGPGGWYIQPNATGTADELVIPQFASGYAIKLTYMAPHPQLVAYSDALNESIHPQLVVYRAALNLSNWYREKTRTSDQWLVDQIARLEKRTAEMEARYTEPRGPQKPGKIVMPGAFDPYTYEFQVNKVRL